MMDHMVWKTQRFINVQIKTEEFTVHMYNIYMSMYVHMCEYIYIYIYTGCFTTLRHTAGGDFLGLCDEKSSYKHVSDFGRLRSYDCFLIHVHALV